MRLDKFLCEVNIGSRTEVKAIIKKGLVSVNDRVIKKPDAKIDETNDTVSYKGTPVIYEKYSYYILNKPQGIITAREDKNEKTVLDLLHGVNTKALSPVGRLDKDTEGLLLLTNDGQLAHNLLSPKKHVEKTYLVGIIKPIDQEALRKLESGVDIGEEKLTKEAIVEILSDKYIKLTIHEGKYHQVKRMLKAVDNQVVSLKRISFGGLTLDEDELPQGTFRELTSEEIKLLYEN